MNLKYHFFIYSIFIFFPFWQASAQESKLLFGAYYYDGWSGENSSKEDWAKNAPRMLTKKLKFEFPEREPIWGWRNDDIRIMERQIDLAAKNGIDFFAFCWYWSDDMGSFNEDAVKTNPRHVSLDLFMKAKNKHKMKFCIMIANHSGASIQGEENWRKTIEYFSDTYFSDSQYLSVDNKPVVMYFLPQQAQPFVQTMKDVAASKGFDGLYSMCCGGYLPSFDAMTWYNTFESSNRSEAHVYSQLFTCIESKWKNLPNAAIVNPMCSVGWDKRPWESEENSVYYINKTPKLFLFHLKNAVDFVYSTDNPNPIIMIYAWNEIGEGGYLIPTKGDPKGKYLKQVKKAKRYAELKR